MSLDSGLFVSSSHWMLVLSLTRSAGTLLPFREGRARWRARDESRATDDDEIQYASQL